MTTVPSVHGALISYGSSNLPAVAGDRLVFSGTGALSADADSTVLTQVAEGVDTIAQRTGLTFGVSLAGPAVRPQQDNRLTATYYLAADPALAEAAVWPAMQDSVDALWAWYFGTYAYADHTDAFTYSGAAGMAGDLVAQDAAGTAQVCAADWDEWSAAFVPGEPGQYQQQVVFTQLSAWTSQATPIPQIATIIGTGNDISTPLPSAVAALSLDLGGPQGVAYNSSGDLFVTCGNTVYTMAQGSSTLTLYAGNTANTAGSAGDGGAAVGAQLNLPQGMACDSSGNLYIADDNNNKIRRVDVGTGFISTYVSGLNGPSGCCFDSAGYLYVADEYNNQIQKVAPGGSPVTVYAGTGTAGYSGDGGAATAATLSTPAHCWCDSADNLFINDSDNNVVRRVDALTGLIATYAGGGVSTADGVLATLAVLGYPALTLSGDDLLYVADISYPDRETVRVVPLSTQHIATVAGTDAGFSGDGGPAATAHLTSPIFLAVDPTTGNVAVADFGNKRVRLITTL